MLTLVFEFTIINSGPEQINESNLPTGRILTSGSLTLLIHLANSLYGHGKMQKICTMSNIYLGVFGSLPSEGGGRNNDQRSTLVDTVDVTS